MYYSQTPSDMIKKNLFWKQMKQLYSFGVTYGCQPEGWRASN